MSLLVRHATLEDSPDIWAWRNDVETRNNSLNQDLISFEEHNSWFKKALINPLIFMYVGILNDQKIGICRFNQEIQTLCFEISINLNPKHRGKKLSPFFLRTCINFLFSQLNSPLELRALIRQSNSASLRLFGGVGFQLDNISGNVGAYRLNVLDAIEIQE